MALRLRPFILLAATTLSLGLMVDCRRLWREVPTLSCQDVRITARPGRCVELTNPCVDGQWWDFPRMDSFDLINMQNTPDPPSTLGITTTRKGATVRELCVSGLVEAYFDHPVGYLYARNGFGIGKLLVTTVTPPALGVSATPETVAPGETSQLAATVSGGAGPYTYVWEPATGLDAANIPNPVASPDVTTRYTVTVSDRFGQFTTAETTVTVTSQVIVRATPHRVDPFNASQLSATVEGAVPPFIYQWEPVDALDDPSSATPTTFPEFTTTYMVTVTDALGARFSGSGTVIVNLNVDAQAAPVTVNEGGQVFLFAFASGGLPPYTYLWSPSDSINNPTIDQPIATPSATTTYTVFVTDVLGARASGSAPVFVNPATGDGPVARFTFSFDGVETVSLDASASTGTIVSYRWDFSLSPGNPDLTLGTPLAEWFADGQTSGSITLTVVDNFNRTSTMVVSFP